MPVSSIENTAEIINKIIACSERLFRKYGYKKTTVDEISAEARISKKTLYSIFPSKETILTETIWNDCLKTVQLFSDTVSSGMKSNQLLLSFCRFIFTDRMENGKDGYFWGLYCEDEDIQTASYNALKRTIRNMYEQESAKGPFKPIDSSLASESITNMIISALNKHHLTEEPCRMYNEILAMIADAVAYKNHILFDAIH